MRCDRMQEVPFNGTMSGTQRALCLAGAVLLLLQASRARSSVGRIALGAAASTLAYSGATGNAVTRALGLQDATASRAPLHVLRTVMVNRPAEELYAIWRNFENLPTIMQHLDSVRVLDAKRSLWRARSPLGGTVEWEAELTHEVPDRELGWRSLPGSEVHSTGVVRFEPSPLGYGTQLQVEMLYAPPAGRLGATVARLLGEEPHHQIDDDLHRFKERMESPGGIPAGSASPLGEQLRTF
jgi:uncharacterized membrane protein